MGLTSLFTRIKYTALLMGMFTLSLHAQVNSPVMATVQLNPPYSLYLTDYAAPDVQRMQVHLLLKDLTATNYKCRLRLTIEGFGVTLQSKSAFYTAPILLNGGETTTLSGPDLAPYFNPQNLLIQGLDNNTFSKNGAKLPEGIYKFSVEVLDYNRNYVVSNASFAIVSTFLSYPPIINMPMANTKVEAQNPQNIIFQWVPRHTASINAAFNVAYKFRIVQLIPVNRDPNDAMRTTRPILETMTSQTMLIYGPAEPALTPGESYAVQVQAIEAEGRDMFINDGYSEVVPFVYGEKCGIPSDVLAAVAGRNSLKLNWTSLPSQQAFSVRYREAGNPPSQWYEEDSYVPNVTISGLEPGKKYEYQVKSQCIWGYGDYSPIQSFTMPDAALEKGDFICGRPSGMGAISNRDNIEQLHVGDTITASDFKVIISTVSGANGSFSGTGEVLVPFLNYLSLTVTYSNIHVNTARQMYDGMIQIRQDDPGRVSAALQKTLTELLDNIDNTLQSKDLASLQQLDAASLLGQLDKMKDWDALSPAVKDELGQLEGKLKEVQALQQQNNLTPDEKATLGEKLANDIKILTDKIKSDLKEMGEVLKQLLGIYKLAVKKLRTEYTDEKVNTLKSQADATLDKYRKETDVIINGIIADMGGTRTEGTTTSSSSEVIYVEDAGVISDTSDMQSALEYLRQERTYNTAKVVQLLEKEIDNEATVNMILQALKVNETSFDKYYKQKKDEKVADENMKDDVAAALLKLVQETLNNNIYKK
jgi:hypothetical protein